MYEISVQTEFSAAHSIRIHGAPEPVHGHNWHTTATFEGDTLDADGLLCDFHLIERALQAIAQELHNRHLNDLPPFNTGLNPTAEQVARHIADELVRRLPEAVRARAALTALRVTEAPGCAATYRPNRHR